MGARYGSVGLVVGLATGLGVLVNLVLLVTAGLLVASAIQLQAITAQEVAVLDPAPRCRRRKPRLDVIDPDRVSAAPGPLLGDEPQQLTDRHLDRRLGDHEENTRRSNITARAVFSQQRATTNAIYSSSRTSPRLASPAGTKGTTGTVSGRPVMGAAFAKTNRAPAATPRTSSPGSPAHLGVLRQHPPQRSHSC